MQTRESPIDRNPAKQSTQMAMQSTSIAEATHKDSSAMKAIAIVTMVFAWHRDIGELPDLQIQLTTAEELIFPQGNVQHVGVLQCQ